MLANVGQHYLYYVTVLDPPKLENGFGLRVRDPILL